MSRAILAALGYNVAPSSMPDHDATHKNRSLALAGLDAARPDPRQGIRLAVERAVPAIQLDAMHPMTRPRELDRSARRDLAAMLRRAGLRCSGIDLWIPPEHFIDPARADLAISAAESALIAAGEIASLTSGDPVLCVTLPREDGDTSVAQTLSAAAQRAGAVVADHTWPPLENQGSEHLAIGFDPAGVVASGESGDLHSLLARAAPRLRAARLSDMGPAGRVEPGSGRLDLLQYQVAVATSGFDGDLVIDLRAIRDQEAALDRVLEAGLPGF